MGYANNVAQLLIGPRCFLTVPSHIFPQGNPDVHPSHPSSYMDTTTASPAAQTPLPLVPEPESQTVLEEGEPSSGTLIGARGRPIATPLERKRKSRQNPETYGMFTCHNVLADQIAKEVQRINERQKAKRAIARAKRNEEKAEKKRIELEEKEKAKEERAKVAREKREAKEAAKQRKSGPERRREWLEARGIA